MSMISTNSLQIKNSKFITNINLSLINGNVLFRVQKDVTLKRGSFIR